MNVLQELAWRGLVHQHTDEKGLEEHLESGSRFVYCGFDPTASSLTVGNLVPIILLRHLQKAGHQPVVLLGGATGMIGDPSGKDSERNLLSPGEVDGNRERFLSTFLQILDDEERPPLFENNMEWLSGLSWLVALREVGKHFSVNAMLSKDSIRSRMKREGHGISYTEFSYMLLQAYDFLHLHTHSELGVTVQVAGSDQWSNICAGIDLIRRNSPGAQAFGLTAPLLTKADGTKFGKTESGSVWLSADRTSPYQFHQFWLNVPDSDVECYLKALGQLSVEETQEVLNLHANNPSDRLAQKALADSLTELVHGKDKLLQVKAAGVLFSGDVTQLDVKSFEQVFSEVPRFHGNRADLQNGLPLAAILVSSGMVSSKREARALLGAGAVQFSGRKVDADTVVTEDWLLHGKFLPVRKGKKTWNLLLF